MAAVVDDCAAVEVAISGTELGGEERVGAADGGGNGVADGGATPALPDSRMPGPRGLRYHVATIVATAIMVPRMTPVRCQ